MTKEKIQKLIDGGATRKCNCCNEILLVSDFYIKKSNNENHFRFNSPCKFCSNINRNINYQKQYHRKLKYNLTQNDYEKMLINQNYSCAICGIHREDLNKDLAVDHCHLTGKIRGLLCANCNSGIGFFKENLFKLKSAIKYIKKHK
jgi:hypothetical protein